MRYIDLFAGIGGFRYGIEQAKNSSHAVGGSPNHRRQLLSGQKRSAPACVYSNEWDKYANSVYKKHYGECDQRDIRTVRVDDIPKHDLLCAGFPCQAFSIAGRRGGFADTRGTLFFEIMRVAQQRETPYLLLENVKGLLSHDQGRTFDTMLRAMDELGYDAEWQVLNSSSWVPQNRPRIFIVGYLRGERRPEVFPFQDQQTLPEGVIHEETKAVTALRAKQGGPDVDETFVAPTIRATEYKRGDNQTSVIEDEWRIRRLTPVECERLQGFPDNWTKYGHDGKKISDTQRYKMLGNAVTTNVVGAIAKKLLY